jgi:hypothetical protein
MKPKSEYGNNGTDGMENYSQFFSSVPLFPFVPYSLFFA